jgi:hypothetical protein
VLDGGVEGRPDNVVFYATSNRRHLLPRDMMENERSTAINPGEAIEEKVSLSDRFGLWLGFHKCSQDEYLEMINGYVGHFGLGDRAGGSAPRGAGMGDDARLALGPHRLAVHPGPGRTAGASGWKAERRHSRSSAASSHSGCHWGLRGATTHDWVSRPSLGITCFTQTWVVRATGAPE